MRIELEELRLELVKDSKSLHHQLAELKAAYHQRPIEFSASEDKLESWLSSLESLTLGARYVGGVYWRNRQEPLVNGNQFKFHESRTSFHTNGSCGRGSCSPKMPTFIPKGEL